MGTLKLSAPLCVLQIIYLLVSFDGTMSNENVQKINEVVAEVMRCRDIPGLALSVIMHGETLLAKGYGKADIENNIPVTESTLFDIASVSKQMSSTLLAMLMSEKGITWDTTVKSLLPDFQMPSEFMTESTTINDVVAHRTGLRQNDFVWLNGEFSRDECYSRLRFFGSVGKFRDTLHYNNIVYSIVAKLSEKLGGKPWETLMEEKLFRPLNMTSTTFYDKRAPDWIGFAKAYGKYSKDENLWERNPVGTEYVGSVGPAGAISSNVNDMTKYLHFLVSHGSSSTGESLIEKEKLEELFYPVMVLPQPWFGGALSLASSPVTHSLDYYGRGWALGWYREHRVISHAGNLFGHDGYLTYIPDFNTSIWTNANGPMSRPVIVANLLLHEYITDLAMGAEPWLNKSTVCTYPEPWGAANDFYYNFQRLNVTKGNSFTRPKEEYAGQYGNFEFGNVTVFVNNTDHLQLNYGEIGRYILYPQLAKDRFYIESFGALSFLKDVNSWANPFIFVKFNSSTADDGIDTVFISFFDYSNPPSFKKNLKLSDAPPAKTDCATSGAQTGNGFLLAMRHALSRFL